MDKKVIIYTIISFVISVVLINIIPNSKLSEPKQVYRIYLKGKSLGLIKSKEDLENYIDKKQNQVKKKYGVDKVYAPDDLDIMKEVTYENNIISTENVYKKIENISPFTIEGYTVTINGIETTSSEGKKEKTKDVKLYVLDKKHLRQQ